MKFWVKIVVALCVVLVLGFGIWAFFFREKDEVKAFNRTCELIEYKESLGLREKVVALRKLNYINGDTSKVIKNNTDTNKDILQIREFILSPSIITTYDEGGNVTCYFDSYITLDDYVDSMLVALVPYLKNSSTTSANINNIKKDIKNYIQDLKNFDNSINILNDCQNAITGTEVEMEVLLGNYNSLRNKYRKCLNDGARVLIRIFDIMKTNYGKIKFNTELALMDSFARSLMVSSSVEVKRESYFAHDAHLVLDRLNKVNAGTNIFSADYTEWGFLANYNALIDGYASEYNKALAKHNTIKKKMAGNQELSDIKQGAQTYLVYVLNVLGY